MKIYYDYQIFLHQKFGGISKYYINLINHLDSRVEKSIIAPFYKNYYLNNQNKDAKKFVYIDIKTKNVNFISKNLNKAYTKFLYNYQTPDIFHFTYFNQKYYLKKKSSYVITMYDLIKEKFYNDKYKNEEVNKIKYFSCMDKIICISENTKKDLIDHYKLPPQLIEVIHLGVSFDKSYIKIDNKIPKKPYLLFVGERHKYKNFKNFILAYTKSNRLKKDFDILCFGGNSFTSEEINKIKYFSCMDKIICISENTKKDLIDHYKLSPQLIEVVHLGVSFDKSYIKIDNKIPKKPYLLFVGERYRYKNFILAYTKSNRLKKDFDILCFGGNSFTSEEINFFKEFRISQNIKQINGSDLELNYVYKKARCFIFPSLYEGFGLPLLEAMNMDCPVICSDTSCFSEVTNNAAAMFDPNNIENIIHEIEDVVYDEQKFSDLIIKGRNNIKNFSWQKCAEQTLKVYNSIL